jgi:hypothetical protein
MKNAASKTHLITVTVEFEGVMYVAVLHAYCGSVSLRVDGKAKGSCTWQKSLCGSFAADIPEGAYPVIERALFDAGGEFV